MMLTEEMIHEIAHKAVAKFMAEDAERETARGATTPTPDEEIAARLEQARFRESFGELALAAGVRPAAIKYVVRDAAAIFDSALQPRDGQTHPGDPLQPLSAAIWLEALKQTDRYLFTR